MDLFERLKASDQGHLGKWSEEADGYFMFPKLEGELGPRMQFNDLEVDFGTYFGRYWPDQGIGRQDFQHKDLRTAR